MSDETQVVSAEAGSIAPVPAATEAGQTVQPAETSVPQTGQQGQVNPAQDYKELEKKLGQQGEELGQWRDFFKSVSPVLTKLDTSPELVQAIMDDKIDSKLVSAILAGTVKIEEAQQVVEAQQQVQKEMGTEAYQQANPAEIERRILEKVTTEVKGELDSRFKAADEMKEFEKHFNSFIENTPDFPKYAAQISTWLNEHPDQDDIEVAYNVIKGIELGKAQTQTTAEQIAEEAKNAALNASGGATPASGKIEQPKSAIDDLVSNVANPNAFRF